MSASTGCVLGHVQDVSCGPTFLPSIIVLFLHRRRKENTTKTSTNEWEDLGNGPQIEQQRWCHLPPAGDSCYYVEVGEDDE